MRGADGRLYGCLGAAILGSVIADCVYAVRTGDIPIYETAASEGVLVATVFAILATAAPTQPVRFGWLLGIGYVVMCTIVSSDPANDRAHSTGLTCLFAMGVLLLSSVSTSRTTVAAVAASAFAAGIVRWLTLA